MNTKKIQMLNEKIYTILQKNTMNFLRSIVKQKSQDSFIGTLHSPSSFYWFSCEYNFKGQEGCTTVKESRNSLRLIVHQKKKDLAY